MTRKEKRKQEKFQRIIGAYMSLSDVERRKQLIAYMDSLIRTDIERISRELQDEIDAQ